jgi:outer membrane immunogenic protein
MKGIMMKKLALGVAAAITFASSAMAADMPARTYTKAPI